MHQKLLLRYFRQELKQRTWGWGCLSREVPIGSYSVTHFCEVPIIGKHMETENIIVVTPGLG